MAPYESRLVDERHREVFERLVDWCEQNCDGRHPSSDHLVSAFESATFVNFCSQPDATMDELLTLAKYVTIFFVMDDSSSQALRELIRYLDGSASPGQEEPVAWFQALMVEMRRRGMRTAAFRDAVRDLVAGMLDERALGYPPTPEQYVAIRRRTIANEPYVQCWVALRHRNLTNRDAGVWAGLAMSDLTKDILSLVNDLGSLDRDLAPSSGRPEMNFVMVRREGPPGLADRIEATIANTNRMFAQAQNRLQIAAEASVALNAPVLADYVDFFTWLINGNTRSTLHLAHRYPGATERLNRIDKLDHVL